MAASVTLRPPLSHLFRDAMEVLSAFVREKDMRLAGGTALAARWDHRHSTDIDLVCDRETFPQNRIREIRDRLLAMRLRGHEITGIAARHGFVGWKTPHGPVSFVPSRLENFPRLTDDIRVDGTNVRLASVEAILYGKLSGRLVGRGRAATRDGYDLAAALLIEPDKARWLLDRYDPDETIRQAVRRSSGKLDGRPILDPRFPRIAADPWSEAERILVHGGALSDYERAAPEA